MSQILKKNTTNRNLLFTTLICLLGLGVVCVLYFSWINSPRFSSNFYMPKWIANWANKESNYNLRTSIPFLFLGMIASFFLLLNKSSLKFWIMAWLILVVLVILAELGQLLLPLRSFDFEDIFWGAFGALVPLLLVYLINIQTQKSLNEK